MLRRGTDRGEDRGRLGVDKDCLWSTLGGLWVVEMPRCPGCQGKSTATSRRSPPRAVSQCTEGIARISDRGRKCNPRAPSLCSVPLFLNLKLDGTIHLVTHRHFATGLSEGHVHGTEYGVLGTPNQSINSPGHQGAYIGKREECHPSNSIVITLRTEQLAAGPWSIQVSFLRCFFVCCIILGQQASISG